MDKIPPKVLEYLYYVRKAYNGKYIVTLEVPTIKDGYFIIYFSRIQEDDTNIELCFCYIHVPTGNVLRSKTHKIAYNIYTDDMSTIVESLNNPDAIANIIPRSELTDKVSFPWTPGELNYIYWTPGELNYIYMDGRSTELV